jgi:serine protease DegQ
MRKTWLIFSQAVTVAVAVLFVVSTLKPDWLPSGGASGTPSVVSIATTDNNAVLGQQPGNALAGAPVGYNVAAKRASPAVVSITASKARTRHPHSNDPWFQFFFGDPSQGPEPQVGLGSGVIVSPEGYLLTNNHVIEGADDIEVMLADGRKAQAKVVGADPETDVAVLKIELEKLPIVTFGDADKVQVGDVVLAIGNPFGVGQTVTSGIVSALGRNQLGINTFENFIQTDAAINPGNSGGALVDANGNLVGINTAIYSRSGGNLGIGFAIPATTARQVMEGLVKDGMVTRGWIGVEPRDLTPEIAETFNLPVKEGVLITGVLQKGPASAGGIRPGDVVVKVADTPVANTAQLLSTVAALKPNAPAVISVQRGDKALDLTVTVGQRPRTPAPRGGR